MRQPFLKSLRSAFFAGVIVLAPLAVTVWVFNWLIGLVGERYRPLFRFFQVPESLLNDPRLGFVWNLLATLIVVLLVTLLGFLSRYFLTRMLFNQAERLMQRVPLINAVYSTVKQIVETFTAQRRAVFQKVVLIPFPRTGCYALGFLTSKTGGETQQRTVGELWNIFVPTTPNPTSGFLIMVPRDQVTVLDMTVGEGMKLIISGGAVVPKWTPHGESVTLANPPMVSATPASPETPPADPLESGS